jgi:hypothetical protein
MKELDQVIALHVSVASIQREQLRDWMACPDIRIRGAAYVLLTECWSRITPSIGMEETGCFAIRYLLDCLIENHESEDYLLGGFEAGHALAGWLKSLARHEDARPILADTARQLADLYRHADDKSRNRIETGAVEHILESPTLRQDYAFWKDDPLLRPAYEACLAWGLAHESAWSAK